MPPTPASPPDEPEDAFWNTPGAAGRTLHFTGDSLLDEEIDINDVSAASFGTPIVVPNKTTDRVPLRGPPSRHTLRPEEHSQDVQAEPPEEDDDEAEVESFLDDDEADETAEPTVVFKKAPLQPPPEDPPVVHPPEPQRVSPAEDAYIANPTLGTSHRSKVKVTTELERIVVRDIFTGRLTRC